MHRFMFKIRVGIATHHGWGRPRSPLLVDVLMMRWACRGVELRLVSPTRNFSWSDVMVFVMSLFQRCQWSGSLDVLQRTSAAKRWVILWEVCVLNNWSWVWKSSRPESSTVVSASILATCSLIKFWQKACEPMGTPRMHSPSTLLPANIVE